MVSVVRSAAPLLGDFLRHEADGELLERAGLHRAEDGAGARVVEEQLELGLQAVVPSSVRDRKTPIGPASQSCSIEDGDGRLRRAATR
jgi:hypothetical protein